MGFKMTETSWGWSLLLDSGTQGSLRPDGLSNSVEAWVVKWCQVGLAEDSHMQICFVMHFLLGNLSFWNISWSPANNLPEGKGVAFPQHPWRMWRVHLPPMCGQVTAEKLLDHVFSNCPNAGSGRLLCVPRNFSFPACRSQLCTPRQ